MVVTGAAGFIGSHLVTRLVADGAVVVGIDNERSGDWSRVGVACERVERDLTALDEEELTGLLEGADVLFHLAAEKYNSSRSSPQRVIDVNVSATQRLFAAAGRAGVAKIVFTSSLYAYGSMGPGIMRETDVPAPHTVYGMSKVAGEHLLRINAREHPGTGWTVARLFFVYGPRQFAEGGYKSVIVSNFERLLAGEAPTIYGDGLQALDYVFVDDLVTGLLAMTARTHDGALYNLASGDAVPVHRLTELMIDVAGCDVRPRSCPADWTAGSVRVGDPTLARERLGWEATVPLETGLRRVWSWMTTGSEDGGTRP